MVLDDDIGLWNFSAIPALGHELTLFSALSVNGSIFVFGKF